MTDGKSSYLGTSIMSVIIASISLSIILFAFPLRTSKFLWPSQIGGVVCSLAHEAEQLASNSGLALYITP